MTYGADEICDDALADRIYTTECAIDDDTYHIWTKKLPVSQLGDGKLVITEEETDNDEDNPVKYLATNKIAALIEHVIRSYAVRWRIETFSRTRSRILAWETARCSLTKVPVVTGTF